MNWKSFKNIIQTILHARKKGLLFLKKANHPARLECLGGDCGLCCEVLGSGVSVNEEEAKIIGEKFIVRTGNVTVLKSHESTCCLLKDKFCSRYGERPQGCREYPWYNVNGELYYDSGCPGMKYDRDERPSVRSLKPLENYLPGFPKIFQKIIKKFLIAK